MTSFQDCYVKHLSPNPVRATDLTYNHATGTFAKPTTYCLCVGNVSFTGLTQTQVTLIICILTSANLAGEFIPSAFPVFLSGKSKSSIPRLEGPRFASVLYRSGSPISVPMPKYGIYKCGGRPNQANHSPSHPRQQQADQPTFRLSVQPPQRRVHLLRPPSHLEAASYCKAGFSWTPCFHHLVHPQTRKPYPCLRCRSPRSPCPRLFSRGSVWIHPRTVLEHRQRVGPRGGQRARLRPLPWVNASNRSH